MKRINVGINGLGRIGRACLKEIIQNKKFDLKVVNDIDSDLNNAAYLLNYDSIYGQLKDKFEVRKNKLENKDADFLMLNKRRIDLVNWKNYNLDYLIDCTGVKENVELCKSVLLKNRLKNIFISHSPKNVDFHMILGVNEKKYLKTKHKILSSSICDATAIAPVLKILNENFKIINGSVTTIHPALNYQNLLDNKCVSWSDPKNFFNTYALGRSTVGNIIPKNTTALEAVCQAYKGISPSQLISFSYRTENLIVASADLTINLKKKTTKKNIQKVFKDFEKNQKFKIIKNINEPLVSLDFKNSKFSCNVDHRWIELNKNTLKMILWYDNEAGYSSNLVNQIIYVNSQNLN